MNCIVLIFSKDRALQLDATVRSFLIALSGCMADGPTYEEPLKNVWVIIEEWIETAKELCREIPVPKGKLAYA